MRELPKFLLLYTGIYAGYGVASPFLPAFLAARGISPEELGYLLAAGTAARLATAPLAGRIGDFLQALRPVLAASAAAAALATFLYVPAHGFWVFLAITVLHAGALAPITVLADALALGAAGTRKFEYGWVRGTGSAAFIAATLASGQVVGMAGLTAIVWMQAALLGVAALAALMVPEIAHTEKRTEGKAFSSLLRIAPFRNLVLVAALVLGSHAMHDAFAVIRWSAAGIGPGAASLLWSEAVAAEVVVFFFIGPALVTRLTPAGALALAALAGIVRWTVMAQTADLVALALVQPLHGITFALLHLACMRLIARHVPDGLEGTAQAVYATVGVGGATALLTLLSGLLYARLDAQAFWIMGALCLAALPVAFRLRS